MLPSCCCSLMLICYIYTISALLTPLLPLMFI